MSLVAPTLDIAASHPVGLVSDIVWARFAGITTSQAALLRKRHGIAAPRVTNGGGSFPGNRPQIWTQWVDEWGANRVKAWLAKYRPDLVDTFKRHLPRIHEPLESMPVTCTTEARLEARQRAAEGGPAVIVGSIAWRILQALPGTRESTKQALADVAPNRFSGAWSQMVSRGHIACIDGVWHQAKRTPKTPAPGLSKSQAGKVKAITGDDEDDDETTETEGQRVFAVYRLDPSRGPRADCPSFGSVAIGECLDNYVTATAGIRTGLRPCAHCPIGKARRISYGGHDWTIDNGDES